MNEKCQSELQLEFTTWGKMIVHHTQSLNSFYFPFVKQFKNMKSMTMTEEKKSQQKYRVVRPSILCNLELSEGGKEITDNHKKEMMSSGGDEQP